MSDGLTDYSKEIPGDRRNFNWAARFDLTDGCLGISQFEGGKPTDRILLSPKQTEGLVMFLRQHGAYR